MGRGTPEGEILTERFHCHYKQLLPGNFEISQLNDEKLSWIVSVLRTLESSLLGRESKPPTRQKTEPSGDGRDTLSTQKLITTRSILYRQKRDWSSPKDSSKLFRTVKFTEEGTVGGRRGKEMGGESIKTCHRGVG